MTLAFTHARDSWVGALPVSGPAFDWTRIDRFVFHYTAADDLIDGDPGEHAADLPAYLRAINREYWGRKTAAVPTGYAIGYNAAVDWLGGTWELRGDTYRCAANGCLDENRKNWNVRSFALLCLVDGADPLTSAAVAAAQDLIAQVRAHSSLEVAEVPHRGICATACPGAGIVGQIDAGLFRPPVASKPKPPPTPAPEPPPEPEPTPTEEDDPMYIARSAAGQYAVGDSVKKAIYNEADVAFPLARAERAGRPLIDESTGTPVTHTAWKANKALVSQVSDSQFRTLGTG